MRFRDRNTDQPPGTPGGPVAGDGGGSELRARAERLLAAGDAAIERALSRDSTAYLRANRQIGGQ
jgi:hypothetical protein